MDSQFTPKRRQLVAEATVLVATTAGCLRFTTDDESTTDDGDVSDTESFEPAIEAVEVPAEIPLHDDARITARVGNDGDAAGAVTVVVAVGGNIVGREPVALESGADATIDADFTPVTAGEREFGVRLEDESTVDRWTDSFVVTGRKLTLEWSDTFVPADNVDTASDTRHLAFACFELRLLSNGTVLEEYGVGTDERITFVDGAYPSKTFDDSLIEAVDGESGRWLGTDESQTVVVLPNSERVETADTLELVGYSLFDRETTVTALLDWTTVDTATVPTRGDEELRIEIDLQGHDGS
jgi:hypothetical protein